MTNLVLANVNNLQDTTTSQTTINNNSAATVAAVNSTLSIPGPNILQSNIDMNNFQIINLAQPATAHSPVRLQEFQSFQGGGTITNIPAGGTTGQFLVKTNNSDYQVNWSSTIPLQNNLPLAGTISGVVTLQPQANAGTYNFNLPIVAGNANQVLTSQGGGSNAMTFQNTSSLLTAGTGISLAGTTNVTISVANVASALLSAGTGITISGTTPATIALTVPVTVANGGTNATSASGTAVDNISGFSSTGFLTRTGAGTYAFQSTTNGITLANLAQAAAGTVLGNATGSTANVTATAAPVLGTTGTIGTLGLSGNTSGVVTIKPQAAAGTFNFNLPITAGSANAVLTSQGGGTTAMTWSNAGQLPATATNDNASAGNVGEYFSSSVAAGSAVALTTNTAANITSISLTAGDWDVWGSTCFTVNAATTVTQFLGWTSTTSASAPTLPGNGSEAQYLFSTAITGQGWSFPVGTQRLSLSTTTTVFLSCICTFAVNTASAFGFIGARRVR